MTNFEDIQLKFSEKTSLFSFHFKKKKKMEKIRHFHKLYYDFQFIAPNYSSEVDAFNRPLSDGTYSISDRYCRYKIWRRKKRFESLPNWLAILISLISLFFSGLTLLWQLGYLQP